MSQILDPIPNNQRSTVLCCYVNATSQIQVARITNVSNWYFERVVFPGQRLVFESIPDALLEIHTGMMASAILSDTIPCERLCIDDSNDSALDGDHETGSQKTDNKQKIESQDKKTIDNKASLQSALVSAS